MTILVPYLNIRVDGYAQHLIKNKAAGPPSSPRSPQHIVR